MSWTGLKYIYGITPWTYTQLLWPLDVLPRILITGDLDGDGDDEDEDEDSDPARRSERPAKSSISFISTLVIRKDIILFSVSLFFLVTSSCESVMIQRESDAISSDGDGRGVRL